MRPTAAFHEVFAMRFCDVLSRYDSRTLSADEAADILSISVSTFYRKRKRFEDEQEAGLVDKRIGRLSGRRVPVDEAMRIISLYKTQYTDFTVKHFHEHLLEQGVKHSYTWVKNTLQDAQVVKKAKKRGQHRRKRPRKPLPGMMLHQDGSTHEWVPGKMWDLIVTMDDATSEIYSIFFCDQEGTQSSFRGFHETFLQHGLPCSVYTDRATHYFLTPKAGEKVAKNNLTQVGRAMQQLGIEMIPAYSPQARGRSERMFGTLQKRLPQELRIHGITSMEAANEFLRTTFLPSFNARFVRRAEEEGSAFVACQGCNISNILCIHHERQVGNDNTVRYGRRILQILPGRVRLHYAKCTVRVHEYFDGTVRIFHGPRSLESEEVHTGRTAGTAGALPDIFMVSAHPPCQPCAHQSPNPHQGASVN